MATQVILQGLFELAKASLYFKGLSEEDIWKACLSYQDRPDEDIEVAMDNIRKEDEKIAETNKLKQEDLLKNQEKMVMIRRAETVEREQDSQQAIEVLDDFFK